MLSMALGEIRNQQVRSSTLLAGSREIISFSAVLASGPYLGQDHFFAISLRPAPCRSTGVITIQIRRQR